MSSEDDVFVDRSNRGMWCSLRWNPSRHQSRHASSIQELKWCRSIQLLPVSKLQALQCVVLNSPTPISCHGVQRASTHRKNLKSRHCFRATLSDHQTLPSTQCDSWIRGDSIPRSIRPLAPAVAFSKDKGAWQINQMRMISLSIAEALARQIPFLP